MQHKSRMCTPGGGVSGDDGDNGLDIPRRVRGLQAGGDRVASMWQGRHIGYGQGSGGLLSAAGRPYHGGTLVLYLNELTVFLKIGTVCMSYMQYGAEVFQYGLGRDMSDHRLWHETS